MENWEHPSSDDNSSEDMEDCDHSFVLKDDIGFVCRVCGVVDRKIETIFEFQYNKVSFIYCILNLQAISTMFKIPIYSQ